MRSKGLMLSTIALVGGAALLFTAVRPATAGRCQSVVGFTGGLHCGLDANTSPANAEQACTEAAIANLPLKCEPGWTQVIYDLDQPFPLDPTATSFATVRATPVSDCAGMTDSIPPLSGEVGAIKVPMAGFAVGCWSPPDRDGCREAKFLNGGAMCLHLAHEPLTGCVSAECQNLSTEQISISNAGAADHHVCPPNDTAVSCRATRGGRQEKFRLWIGGFCSTNGCDNPGVDPQVGEDTCVSQWGATYFGYNRPKNKGINSPGWYDWQTGAFKVDYTNGKATCGRLGQCLGGDGKRSQWDLRVVGVPRASTPPPCLTTPGAACGAQNCVP